MVDINEFTFLDTCNWTQWHYHWLCQHMTLQKFAFFQCSHKRKLCKSLHFFKGLIKIITQKLCFTLIGDWSVLISKQIPVNIEWIQLVSFFNVTQLLFSTNCYYFNHDHYSWITTSIIYYQRKLIDCSPALLVSFCILN